MDMSKSVSEPLRRIIDHHNSFNRLIKLLFGSLKKVMSEGLQDEHPVTLPYGTEPWGGPKQWSSSADGHAAAALLAELGIVRAASAFEDYLQGVVGELDRAEVPAPTPSKNNIIERVIRRVSTIPSDEPPLDLVKFFDCARNCIVHQMGRANSELVDLSVSEGLVDTLASLTSRKTAKWKPVVPAISIGEPVAWRPRHAIMASDCYYRTAVSLDRNLLSTLGEGRFIAMAAHWSVSAPIAVVEVKHSLIKTIRSALSGRYLAKVKANEIAPMLKSVNRWEQVKSSFHAQYPDRPID